MNIWKTISRGTFTEEEMEMEIRKFINADNNSDYSISIGTDSQHFYEFTRFVTAIVIHRKGKGAQYFYKEEKICSINSLRQKIFHEALETYKYREWIHDRLDDLIIERSIVVEPHIDIGYDGATKKFISEITNMFEGHEPAIIKPYSIAASCVADKHTK